MARVVQVNLTRFSKRQVWNGTRYDGWHSETSFGRSSFYLISVWVNPLSCCCCCRFGVWINISSVELSHIHMTSLTWHPLMVEFDGIYLIEGVGLTGPLPLGKSTVSKLAAWFSRFQIRLPGRPNAALGYWKILWEPFGCLRWVFRWLSLGFFEVLDGFDASVFYFLLDSVE